MWWKGFVIWSFVVVLTFRAIPRFAPHRPRLARFAVGCLGLLLVDALYSWLSDRPAPMALRPDQGLLLNALDGVAFIGMFVALICGAVIAFTDRR